MKGSVPMSGTGGQKGLAAALRHVPRPVCSWCCPGPIVRWVVQAGCSPERGLRFPQRGRAWAGRGLKGSWDLQNSPVSVETWSWWDCTLAWAPLLAVVLVHSSAALARLAAPG